jgi:hypothetical protein
LVDSLLADATAPHYLFTLGVVEIHSAFGRLVRDGNVTVGELDRLRGRLRTDIVSGLWPIVQVTPAGFQQAE